MEKRRYVARHVKIKRQAQAKKATVLLLGGRKTAVTHTPDRTSFLAPLLSPLRLTHPRSCRFVPRLLENTKTIPIRLVVW